MAKAIVKFGGSSFSPSASLTGNNDNSVLRGKNMMLRGSGGSYYFEAFGGVANLNERIPTKKMTGTIEYEEDSTLIIGTGTQFRSEMRFGQKFVAGEPTQVFVVDNIISDTEMTVQRPPDASATAVEAEKLPHLFEIDNKRGTLVWGNALKFDRGNIVAVGDGELRINGQPLEGESFIATPELHIAKYDGVTQEYEIQEMGLPQAPAAGVGITITTGGTKDMDEGLYSFRWAWANTETGWGFGNPSEVIKKTPSNAPLEITGPTQRFRLDFTTGLASRPANADAIIIYRSLFSDAAQNTTQYGEGSWFMAKKVLISDLEAGDITYVDVLDGELSTEVTFDNDMPPKADWVTVLAGDPVLVSCYGNKLPGSDDRGEAPGPFVSPSRRGNRDAFPAETATVISPPEEIIGCIAAVGRLFLLTKTGLKFAASTGQIDFPIETRAFWQTGFRSPYGLQFVNADLYAYTFKGMTRSVGSGDVGSEQFAFAAGMEDILHDWHAGYVHAVEDKKNEMVVFIHSAHHRSADGWWVSLALPFYLRHGIFGPLLEIAKPDRDMIVCGAANIGGKLQFLAGGAVEPEDSEESSEESSEEPEV